MGERAPSGQPRPTTWQRSLALAKVCWSMKSSLPVVLAAWPALLRERMETTDGSEALEHARDRGVSSASAADHLCSMPTLATPGNATALVPAASGMPAASDASLCAEAESASASTPTTISSAPAREADAGTAGSGCKRCTAGANAGRVGPHTCSKKRGRLDVVARVRSSRQRALESSLPLLPPPETPPVQPPSPAAEAATSTRACLTAGVIDDGSGSQDGEDEMMSVADEPRQEAKSWCEVCRVCVYYMWALYINCLLSAFLPASIAVVRGPVRSVGQGCDFATGPTLSRANSREFAKRRIRSEFGTRNFAK